MALHGHLPDLELQASEWHHWRDVIGGENFRMRKAEKAAADK